MHESLTGSVFFKKKSQTVLCGEAAVVGACPTDSGPQQEGATEHMGTTLCKEH